jgi:hypothetical protein
MQGVFVVLGVMSNSCPVRNIRAEGQVLVERRFGAIEVERDKGGTGPIDCGGYFFELEACF